MTPVICDNFESLSNQAAKMRKAALDNAICMGDLTADESKTFTGMTDEEWESFQKKFKNGELSSNDFPCSWALRIKDKILSVSLSFEKYKETHFWHVSMVQVTPFGMAEIRDEVASKLAKVFMDSNEIEALKNEGRLPSVKHFTAVAK